MGGDVDVLEARLEELAEQGFQNGFVTHLEHGLGATVGQRAQPGTKPPRHDEDRIIIARRLRRLLPGFQPDQLAGFIDHRQGKNAALTHGLQQLCTGQLGRNSDGGSIHHRRNALRQRDIVQDGAANITVSDHPQQMLLLIHDQTDSQRLFIDHCQGIAHRMFRRQHHFFPILAHPMHPLLLDRHHAAPGNVCNLL
ncbi:hypothetical protein D3C80_1012680 [compost metagenome]